MHGCSNHVGCLSVSAYRVGQGIVVGANRIGKGLLVNCSIICTVNKSAYLYVDPNVLWLTPEMLSDAKFDITSNVNWNID